RRAASVYTTAQKVLSAPAGRAPRRCHDVRGDVEQFTDPERNVRVAPERDGVAALLVPPAHQRGRGQRASGVELERSAGTRKCAEDGSVLLLEISLAVLPYAPSGPVPAWVVAMGKHLEDVG